MKILQRTFPAPMAAFLFLLTASLFVGQHAQAATHDITMKNGDNLTIPVFTGDTGMITPDLTTITIPDSVYSDIDSEPATDEDITPSTPEDDPSNPDTNDSETKDSEDDPSENKDLAAIEKARQEAAQKYLESLRFDYSYDNDNTIAFDTTNHSFTAQNPGNATITIRAYSPEDSWDYSPVFTATVTITVTVDMANVTLSENSYTVYLSPMYYYGKKKPYYNGSDTDFQIAVQNCPYVFYPNATNSYSSYYDYDDYDENDMFQYSYTQSSKVSIQVSLANNIFNISAGTNTDIRKTVTSILTITLSGKTFQIPITFVPVTISDHSCLLVKGKKQTLKVNSNGSPIQWTSTNPKVATVNANGVVKGKKIGNCVIIGKIGNAYVGCAVSVTTAKLKKVATYATYMGTHWKYSQALRTKNGYYDCSALVWKAYKKHANFTFGSPGYPSVALSEAKWCNAHKRMIKGGFRYKKISKMYYNPGDLIFKSSNMKQKYADIYHVEMITGYYCYGVSPEGKPYIDLTWGARGPGYGVEEGSLVGRPLK